MNVMITFNYADSLDKLIGMIEGGTLILITGSTGVGKTTMACYLSMFAIYKQNKLKDNDVFVIIDGDGGFSEERAKQIIGKDWEEIKARIVYKEVTDFGEQHDLTATGRGGSPSKLEVELEKSGLNPVLIVFDPFTAAARGIITRTDMTHRAAVISQYYGKLDLQLQTLRGLGVKKRCPVIITTWPSSPVGLALSKGEGTGNELPFIGGRALGFYPKIIVELKAIRFGDGSRVAVLFKHRSRPAGTTVKFKLVNEGVV